MMARIPRDRVQDVSIGFRVRIDELEYARTVGAHFGTDHHEFVVRPTECRSSEN